jgi:hypothetical protein
MNELAKNVLPLTLGFVFITGGILGKRFSTGLTGGRPAPAWYGRTWLIGFGTFLVGGAIARILRDAPYHTFLVDEKFWSNSQRLFFAVFEAFNGVGLMIGGVIYSVHYFKTREWKPFWMSVAAAIAGEPFAYEGIRTLIFGP